MQVLISDANVLIDMEAGQLLELMFNLPFEFKVSDMLFVDELSHQHAHLLDLGLRQTELTANSMMDAMRMTHAYAGPSRYDCFSLALAKQEGCPLLTGDVALRKAAQKEDVIVKGTIWLVEQMIEHNLISKLVAGRAYQSMQDAGSRLPWDDALKRLDEIGR
jgi:predicted nucleic acid-binding protein